MPTAVIDTVRDYLAEESELGGYEAAEKHRSRIDRFYDTAAEFLGCKRDEIAFAENATRAWDMAFYALQLSDGDRVLTSMSEYASNYIAFLQVTRRTGARIEVVPNDDSGQLSVEALSGMLDERVKLVAVTHVPTNGGLVNPAAQIGALTRAAGVTFLLDACQSAGQLPLDVDALGCDLLSFTGRKYVRGPRGTGLLYARTALAARLEPPLLDLHAATWVERDRYELQPGARRFETWESNVAGKLGLERAMRYALDVGLDAISNRVAGLAGVLRAELAQLPGVMIRDLGVERCGIVTFTIDGRDARTIRNELRDGGFSVWHSASSSTKLDMDDRGLESVVRASVHYYNDEQELARFTDAVRGQL